MTKLVKRLLCTMMAIMMCFGGMAFAAEKQSELPLTTKGETLVIYCDFNASQSSVYSDLTEHPVIKKTRERCAYQHHQSVSNLHHCRFRY